MRKIYTIKNLRDKATWHHLEKRLFPYGGNLTPLKSLLGILDRHGAMTVIIEDNYVDKDYQDEFAAFYSRAFKIYQQRCTRLHFFAKDIPADTSFLDLGRFHEQYLGFIVLRPTDLQKIGRTILKPFINNPNTEFVSCKAKFYSHIAGEIFTIDAMPFIQQDTQVGACAQAALWMVARYMSQRFGYREFMPGEINHLAKSNRAFGRPLPAEWGLNIEQMLDALAGMGYAAVVYARANIDDCSCHIDDVFTVDIAKDENSQQQQKHLQQTIKLADIAYRYIESGLPVILCTANHALVAAGHEYDHKIKARIAIERIPAFIVNNDAAGPYGKISILHYDHEHGDLSFQHINEIIVLVPPEVTLRGEEAESMASACIKYFLDAIFEADKTWRQALEQARPVFRDWFKCLEFRTYLRLSVEWQAELRQCLKKDDARIQAAPHLLGLDYPKYVWITEISSSPLLNQATSKKRQCLGLVVVDSTAPVRTRGAIAMHFADMLVIHNRQSNENKPEMHYIKNSTPFCHKIWQA